LERIQSEAAKHSVGESDERKKRLGKYVERGATTKLEMEQINDLTNELKMTFGAFHVGLVSCAGLCI
jgi:hypothetical protein